MTTANLDAGAATREREWKGVTLRWRRRGEKKGGRGKTHHERKNKKKKGGAFTNRKTPQNQNVSSMGGAHGPIIGGISRVW